MSRAKPHPKLPIDAELELFIHGLYRWRRPGESWLYCIGRRSFQAMCQEHREGLLVLELSRDRIFPINRVLTLLGYRGRFSAAGGRISYVDRWPYPDQVYFPGMIIDQHGRLMNGAWKERDLRVKFQQQLSLYLTVLRRYLIYRDRYPLPDEEQDCPYCRGEIQALTTMYSSRNHDRLHLGQYQIEGSLLWNALEEAGYGDQGKMQVLGYEAPARPEIMRSIMERYFRLRGGF